MSAPHDSDPSVDVSPGRVGELAADFLDDVDLAAERLGGAVLAASDEFFAEKENLLKPGAPVFREGAYTDRGKWMDGWESRRKRVPGHDWAIIRLGLRGIVRGVVVDTAFFRGNYPAECSIEACLTRGDAGEARLVDPATEWFEILPRRVLAGDSKNVFRVDGGRAASHLRLRIYPDGGVARLRVHGRVLPDWRALGGAQGEVDLAALETGGQVLACSDMFFGPKHNLIQPGRAPDMGDGWETRRRRGPGHDWVEIGLCGAGSIARVEIDTSHFKGNYPDTCALEALGEDGVWRELLPRTKLEGHTRHFFVEELRSVGTVTRVRLAVYPDGGVSRLRVWGSLTRAARGAHGVRRLNALTPTTAAAELARCCAAQRWVACVIEARPFGSFQEVLAAADDAADRLAASDWLDAFAHHPRIGDRTGLDAQTRGEQAGVEGSSDAVRAELVERNRAYEERFGFVYLTCATGKSGDVMLAELRVRLQNTRDQELATAAGEQRKITRLRLEKLLLP